MKILYLAIALASAIPVANAGKYTEHVNPFIGTGAVNGGLSGNNYPGATVPFGMIQLSPDTHPAPDWFNASGYNYNDSDIHGFSHTHLSGTGACDLIDVTFFPSTSDSRYSSFSHDKESARPGYYSVFLDKEGIQTDHGWSLSILSVMVQTAAIPIPRAMHGSISGMCPRMWRLS